MRLFECRIHNFKRITVANILPQGPLTRFVGDHGAGKSSALDALAALVGGAGESPAMPIRHGESEAVVIGVFKDPDDPSVGFQLKMRFVDDRRVLDMVDLAGRPINSPQTKLNALFGKRSFDPMAFIAMKPADQAAVLARIAGIDLAAYEASRKAVFDERTIQNRQVATAKAQLAGMPDIEAPDEEVSVVAMVAQLREANEHNSTRQRGEAKLVELDQKNRSIQSEIARLENMLAEQRKLEAANIVHHAEVADYLQAMDPPIDTSGIQSQIAAAESTNAAVRARRARADKRAEVAKYERAVDLQNAKLGDLDAAHAAAINAANLPIPGVSFTAAGVTVDGIPFEQRSGMEKLRTSVAIGIADNPKCPFMTIDEGGNLNDAGMKVLEELAEQHGMVVFIARPDDGDEPGIRFVNGETITE